MNPIYYYYALSFLMCRKWKMPNSGAKTFALCVVFCITLFLFMVMHGAIIVYCNFPKLSLYVPEYGTRKLMGMAIAFSYIYLLHRHFESKHVRIIQLFKERYKEISWARWIVSLFVVIILIVLGIIFINPREGCMNSTF